MMSYLYVGAGGFLAGVVVTWLYARRLTERLERMLARVGDMLPRSPK